MLEMQRSSFSKTCRGVRENENNNYSNLILDFYICALTLAIKPEDLHCSVCARDVSIVFSTRVKRIHSITCCVIRIKRQGFYLFIYVCLYWSLYGWSFCTWTLALCEGKALFLAKCSVTNLSDYRVDFLYVGAFRGQEG